MKKVEIITKSPEETQEIGKEIAQKNTDGGVICLHGDLGSGKTTFTQGLAQELGIERRVNSPTFIIMRTYEVKNDRFIVKSFYHLDLYRVENERDIEGLGVREILSDPENIVVIEWPEKIEKLLQEKRTDIYFTYLSETERKIEIHED